MPKPSKGQTQEPKLEPVDLALVLGYIATKDLTSVEKKVGVLSNLGYSNAQMIKITGAKSQTVWNAKSNLKGGHKNA